MREEEKSEGEVGEGEDVRMENRSERQEGEIVNEKRQKVNKKRQRRHCSRLAIRLRPCCNNAAALLLWHTGRLPVHVVSA